MIVRIMTDNQYDLGDESLPAFHQLDDQLEQALDGSDPAAFAATLHELTEFVRQHGQVVPDGDLRPSDLMIPAPDMTLAEAQQRLHPVPSPPDTGA